MSKRRFNYCKQCRRKIDSKHQFVCNRCATKRIVSNGFSLKDAEVVYGLYDIEDKLLYVGVTNSVVRRTAQHMCSKNFVKLEILRNFESRDEADAFEIFAINNLKPPLNIKIEPVSTDFIFDLSDLDIFGSISNKALHAGNARKCQECDTILSKYNETVYCRRHLQAVKMPSRKQVKKIVKKQLGGVK